MQVLADVARQFRKAGVLESPDALRVLDTIAAGADALLPGVLAVAARGRSARSAHARPNAEEARRQLSSSRRRQPAVNVHERSAAAPKRRAAARLPERIDIPARLLET
jgi:hypothetical protein